MFGQLCCLYGVQQVLKSSEKILNDKDVLYNSVIINA
jgi:hypothetical protein